MVFVFTLPTEAGAAASSVSGINSMGIGAPKSGVRWSGDVGFDSSSFLYKSESRGTAATTLNATLRGKSDSRILHSEGDLGAYTFVNNQPAFGFESVEMYSETRPGVMGAFQYTFGRKKLEWSKLDGTWRMMGLWSPRWTWDELRPQVIGMTGLFLSWRTPRFQAVLFGSPLAIPERGTPIEEQGGNIVSSNPFWRPLPARITVLGASTPVNYSLVLPPIESILFRPNFALRVRYESEGGGFVSLNTGVLPVHMTQMAAEPFLSTSGSASRLDVNIRPQFPMRNITTLESGYDSPSKEWSLWLSGSHERPFRFENKDIWLNPVITPSTIVSTGTRIRLTSNLEFSGAVLYIHEEPFQRSSKVPDVNVQLPSRFPIKQGIQMGGNYRFSDATSGDLSWLQDTLQKNHLVSMNVAHALRSLGLTVGAGMDLVLARNTLGWVGQFYGNDRIRGWLKYAF